jgi:hypothetical protein
LRLLKLRVIVNEHDIYELREREPLVILCKDGEVVNIIVTNGFHFSRKIKMRYNTANHFFEVESFIDNIQLLTAAVLTLIFFGVYIFSGVKLFMLFANLPLLIMLFIFYWKRKEFIQVHRLPIEKQGNINLRPGPRRQTRN